MSLILHYHPLSSYCWKALVALYELDVPFEMNLVDLSDAGQRAALAAIHPFAKFPALVDDENGVALPESTSIIEYVAAKIGDARLIPGDATAAREVRLRDRLLDLYVHNQMQKIVGDRNRPAAAKDPFGVNEARSSIAMAYPLIEKWLAHAWICGDSFTLADCAAAPALYYANRVVPVGDAYPRIRAYLVRLAARPSFARVFSEAEPYLKFFPG